MYVASKPKLISSLIQVVSSHIAISTYEFVSLCRYGEVPKEAIPKKRTVDSTLLQSEMQTRYMTAGLCRPSTPMEMQSGGLHEKPFIMVVAEASRISSHDALHPRIVVRWFM